MLRKNQEALIDDHLHLVLIIFSLILLLLNFFHYRRLLLPGTGLRLFLLFRRYDFR